MNKFFLLIAWFVLAMWLTTLGYEMLSAPNTIENIVGLTILCTFVAISVKTKLLININKLWKK